MLRRKLHEGAKLRKSRASARIVERKPWNLDATGVQHGLQLPLLKVVHHDGTRQAKEPDTPQRRADARLHVIDDQGAFDADRDSLAIDGKLPPIE